MTHTALKAIPALIESVLRLARNLEAEEWASPSACPGWSKHDVIIHLTCTFKEMVDPNSLPDLGSDNIERSNDRAVAAFRGQAPAHTVTEYEKLGDPLLELLTIQQVEPEASDHIDFGDVGTYPTHLMADSLVFAHYCHLRHDLGLSGQDALADITADHRDAILTSSLQWLIAGLPQMSPGRLREVLETPVELELTGPGGGLWTFARRGSKVELCEGSTGAVARITSSGDDFIRWGTHRTSWFDADLTVIGDRVAAEHVAQRDQGDLTVDTFEGRSSVSGGCSTSGGATTAGLATQVLTTLMTCGEHLNRIERNDPTLSAPLRLRMLALRHQSGERSLSNGNLAAQCHSLLDACNPALILAEASAADLRSHSRTDPHPYNRDLAVNPGKPTHTRRRDV